MDKRVPNSQLSYGCPPAQEVPSEHWGLSVPESAIRTQLERLLASTDFRYSERLSRFLRFAVEQQLAGNTDRLKETVLAVEIFDREATYDSHVDSIVRVEARRLRAKLDKYYGGEGREDSVVIALPKGSYVPAFSSRVAGPPAVKPPADVPGKRVPPWAWGAAAMACALIAFAIIRVSPRSLPQPLVRLTSDSGLTFQPTLSRDGKLLAFSSDRGGGSALDIWVQQVPRGTPMRLTDSPGDEVDPAFSPDATVVAYRAEGELDGIYVAPALGGRSTLIARGGYRPRFSPDGRRIVFWAGERTFRTAKVFIVPATGGSPVQVQPGFSYAAYPIWSPDGRHIVFVGARSMVDGDPAVDDWDWWVSPADGGQAYRMLARKTCDAQGLHPPDAGWSHRRILPHCWDRSGRLLFAARSGNQTNIWRVPVSTRNWQVGGQAEQVTFGAGRQDHPSLSEDGALVYSVLTQKSDVWNLPVAAETAEPRGAMARLTSGPADSNRPVVSRDGSRLAYLSTRTGGEEVWAVDLKTGRDRALTATGKDKSSVVITPDGRNIAFGYAAPLPQAVFSVPFDGGAAVQLCADCGHPRAWLPGDLGLVYQRRDPSGESTFGLVHRAEETAPLLRVPGSALYSPSVSADGKWIAMIVRTPPNDHRVIVVPIQGRAIGDRSQWIPVAAPGAWVDKPRWSPGGRMIYYVSDQDGFVCIWARRFDPASKQPVGAAKPVLHFHTGRMSIATVYGLELSVAEGKLVYNVAEVSGNVWLAPADR